MSDATVRTDPHVVIVGGGFGGLAAARGLADAPVRITLIDRRIVFINWAWNYVTFRRGARLITGPWQPRDRR